MKTLVSLVLTCMLSSAANADWFSDVTSGDSSPGGDTSGFGSMECGGSIASCNGGDGTSDHRPVACPTQYTHFNECNNIDVSQVPVTLRCAGHAEEHKEVPLKNSAVCSFDNGNQMRAVASCRVPEERSCDPCVAKDCPVGVGSANLGNSSRTHK